MSAYVQTSANVVAGNDAKASDFNKAVADLAAIIGGITVAGAWGTTGNLTVGGALIPSNATTVAGSAGTVTPTAGATNFYSATALSGSTTIAAPTGSPVDGQILTIRIKDNGAGQALTWNAIYRVIGNSLPTSTVASKLLYVSFRYNAVSNFWDLMGVGQQA